MQTEAFRDFLFPLNVFMLILHAEEPEVKYLHYGLFAHRGESLIAAQERSTALLFEQLLPAPSSILDVGIGLGTTLKMLMDAGYVAQGITPDAQQVEAARARWGAGFPVTQARFEDSPPSRRFDTILFQESAQYIAPAALFRGAAAMTNRIVVLDEFTGPNAPAGGSLHSWSGFLEDAVRHDFALVLERDLSMAAAPSVDYFMTRIPSYRSRLIEELALDDVKIDDLLVSGERYLASYASGHYMYRLAVFERTVA